MFVDIHYIYIFATTKDQRSPDPFRSWHVGACTQQGRWWRGRSKDSINITIWFDEMMDAQVNIALSIFVRIVSCKNRRPETSESMSHLPFLIFIGGKKMYKKKCGASRWNCRRKAVISPDHSSSFFLDSNSRFPLKGKRKRKRKKKTERQEMQSK